MTSIMNRQIRYIHSCDTTRVNTYQLNPLLKQYRLRLDVVTSTVRVSIVLKNNDLARACDTGIELYIAKHLQLSFEGFNLAK